MRSVSEPSVYQRANYVVVFYMHERPSFFVGVPDWGRQRISKKKKSRPDLAASH
jgi:hypothetical protein